MLGHNHIHFHEIYHREDHCRMMGNDVQVLSIYVQLHSQVDLSKKKIEKNFLSIVRM